MPGHPARVRVRVSSVSPSSPRGRMSTQVGEGLGLCWI